MTDNPHRARRFRALAAAVAGAGLIAAPLVGAPAMAAPADAVQVSSSAGAPKVLDAYEAGRYFVVLKEKPSVTYTGGTAGLTATAASEGEAFDVQRPEVAKYERHLTVGQDAVARSAGVQADLRFTRALNAFVAELTPAQAMKLAKDERVLGIAKDEQQKPDYSSTEFLGLPGAKGTWNSTYGGAAQAGKGVVVGVIDSGIYPPQDFVAGEPVQPLTGTPQVGQPYKTADGRTAMLKADGTTAYADCEVGPDFPASSCNDKILGAYKFSEDFERFVPINQRDPRERLSPLDIGSHGTHVATTIVGHDGTEQTMNGQSFGEGSGVAPEAKLIAYKVCWEDTDPNTGGCYTSASVAAVEQAIANNVDVINYSISGNNNSVVDPVALAFRAAAEAGIFVAASGGNSGPGANTVNHSSPWLTTVSAQTFSNEMTGTVEFEDGTKFRGASSATEPAGPAEVVLSTEVAAAGATAQAARLCLPGSLSDAAAEKIVLCERGQNARVEKSQVVADAGGIGMILVNVTEGSLDSDLHAVPTVHVADASIIEKVRAGDLNATLVPEDTTGLPQEPLPQIAGFSSRGPSNAVNQEFLKPDVGAPGVAVLAGVSALDPNYNGDTFGLMSGTSMSSPNVAGMAALLAGKHTDWSPMAIKSALMTTADPVKNADGSDNQDNFATGAGSANPKKAAAPGLVYEADAQQWDALLFGDISGRDVNVASVVVPDVVGSTQVKRTVTATQAGTWKFSSNVPGFEVTASPATLSLAKGQSAEVTLTLTRTSAAMDTWTHGSMSWVRPGAQSVTSPVTLKAKAASVIADSVAEGADAADIVDTGASGSHGVTITPGLSGELTPTVVGLNQADAEEVTKVPGGSFVIGENASTVMRTVRVAPGVESLTVSINAGRPGSDWDLAVVTPSFEIIQQATAAESEDITISSPAAGEYILLANLYATDDGSADTGSLETLQLTSDAGNLTVEPNPIPVIAGHDARATVNWNGLTEGVWRGVVTWAPGVTSNVTITVGAGGGDPVDPDICEVPDFADNPEGSRYYEAVRWMQCEGLSVGYTADNTFRKDRDISRGESLAFVYRYLAPEWTAPSTSPFTDMAPGATFYDAVTWGAAAGVTGGYADGSFRPAQAVTRGEFASFVYRAMGEPEFTAPSESPFTDIQPGQTHYTAITWLHAQGLARGYDDGTFGVQRDISRGEVAAFLYRIDGTR
jgi:hypothetical protein